MKKDKKRQQIIDNLRLIWHHIKMELQKAENLLDAIFNVPRFITKNG